MVETSKPESKQRKPKSVSISQSDFPAFQLEETVKVAQALFDNYAGGPEAPHNIAIAMGLNPTGTQWRMISSAALAYGLTSAAWSADRIALTTIGKSIVAPTSEGADTEAKKRAVLTPKILSAFFTKYDRSKLPKDQILINILIEFGIPKEKADGYRETLIANGRYAGLVKDTTGGGFVALELSTNLTQFEPPVRKAEVPSWQADEDELPAELRHIIDPQLDRLEHTLATPTWDKPVSAVFISHGKNQKILDQVKEIVAFGKFQPIVSKDKETVSKPVPDKVMDDMRGCQAAVIHVASEGALVDLDGKPVHRINENVLIEIGAAMALYRRRFILLVEDGLQLPSNLQGLYEVRYKGGALDGDSTMKLLKAFNDFSS